MISEKNKRKITLYILLSVIIVTIVFAIINTKRYIGDKQTQVYQTNKYVVGVYEEKIAIFTQGDEVPIEIYDVYVTTLPENDQKTLRKGIIVEEKTELKRLIEDYTS